MPKLTPVNYKTLVKIFEDLGFVRVRQEGSHISMVKRGVARPLVIPAHKEVTVSVIQSNMRTAGLNRKTYFELLDKHK